MYGHGAILFEKKNENWNFVKVKIFIRKKFFISLNVFAQIFHSFPAMKYRKQLITTRHLYTILYLTCIQSENRLSSTDSRLKSVLRDIEDKKFLRLFNISRFLVF